VAGGAPAVRNAAGLLIWPPWWTAAGRPLAPLRAPGTAPGRLAVKRPSDDSPHPDVRRAHTPTELVAGADGESECVRKASPGTQGDTASRVAQRSELEHSRGPHVSRVTCKDGRMAKLPDGWSRPVKPSEVSALFAMAGSVMWHGPPSGRAGSRRPGRVAGLSPVSASRNQS